MKYRHIISSVNTDISWECPARPFAEARRAGEGQIFRQPQHVPLLRVWLKLEKIIFGRSPPAYPLRISRLWNIPP
jgi:hypothetical protein